MEKFVLTKDQKNALDAMIDGKNVFLTGGAGTGKTTVIKEFIKIVDPECRHTLLAAPTGKAAINMSVESENGVTIYGSTVHRLFGIKAVTCPKYTGKIPNILKATNILIIDEISMMRIDIFDYVMNAVLDENAAREDDWLSDSTAVPIQIILVGDFFQLPPVIRQKAAEGMSDKEIMDKIYKFDVGKGYCFQSPFWELFNIQMCELTEIMRQKGDMQFCTALNKIRIGDTSGIKYINDNYSKERANFSWITLCGTNESVNRINEKAMALNKNCKYVFKQEVSVDISFKGNKEKFLKDLSCEEELILFVGARVLCIANCGSGVNGMMGIITKITSDDGIMVKWDKTNKETRIDRYTWEVTKQEVVIEEKNGRKVEVIKAKHILTVKQFPLKLAYAITIHKSQGETIKMANIDTNTFETGHLYTALSRCESVQNMKLRRPLVPSDVKYDNKINEFYEKEREVTNYEEG